MNSFQCVQCTKISKQMCMGVNIEKLRGQIGSSKKLTQNSTLNIQS